MKANQGIPFSLVVILAILAAISVANLYYCQPLLNLIRADINLSEFEVNLMPVATQVGYALGLLFIIPMGDLYNRKHTIMICFALLFCSLLVIAYSTNATMLLLSSFLTGVCSVSPQVFLPFVSQFALPKDKEKMVGYVLSGLLIGILTSRVISGYVGYLWGWRAMYIIASGLIAISSILLLKTFPYVEPTFNGKFVELMRSIVTLIKQNPKSITYSTRAGLTFGSFLGLWACLAFRMKEAPFFQDSQMVGLLGICGIAGAMTSMNVGKYVPRIGVEKMNYIGEILIAFSWIILAIFHNSYFGIIAAIIIIDIGMQCVQLSNQSATLKLCNSASSRMNTIFMVTYFVGGSLGTFLSGTLYSIYGWQGTVLSGFMLISLAAIISLVSNKK